MNLKGNHRIFDNQAHANQLQAESKALPLIMGFGSYDMDKKLPNSYHKGSIYTFTR